MFGQENFISTNDDIFSDKMMWLEDQKRQIVADSSDDGSESSGEEVPIWIRGEQRWVSGITEETTCHDVIQVLLQDEENRVIV